MISKNLVDQIIDIVNSELVLVVLCHAIRGYEAGEMIKPLSHPTLSVLPEENKAYFFKDENAQDCIRNEVTIRLNLFAPPNKTSTEIHTIAEIFTDFITDAFLDNLTKYTIGDVSYDDNLNALKLPIHLHFSFTDCALDDTGEGYRSNVPEGFFCKQHVNNSDIHITADEHAYINEPFVTGVYKGTGEAVSVELGFKPSALIVFRYGYHPSVYNSATGKTDNFVSFVFAGRYNYGLSVTDTGFTATQYEGTSANNCMSVNGGYYAYMAFK